MDPVGRITNIKNKIMEDSTKKGDGITIKIDSNTLNSESSEQMEVKKNEVFITHTHKHEHVHTLKVEGLEGLGDSIKDLDDLFSLLNDAEKNYLK